MAASPSPYYADLSWLLYESQNDKRALQQTIEAAVSESWSAACEISTKLLQQKQPPGDLWENAIRRTAIDLRERLPGSVDAGKFLLRYFELSGREGPLEVAGLAGHLPLIRWGIPSCASE